jgi:hypothetical protein
MKWRKQRYNAKANTHRAGWKFWDLLDSNGENLCMVRYIPNSKIGQDYQLFPMHTYDSDLYRKLFDTLKEAQDTAVAYFINQRLEEA